MFWMVFLVWIVLDMMLRGAMALASIWSGNEVVVAVFFWIWIAYSMVTYFPMVAVTIKRLHDTGRSGCYGCFCKALMVRACFLSCYCY
jgi:uncharacterized membrane protein YhaH (DUF805 family)